MIILGTVFFCSLVISADRYKLVGFITWWIASIAICYFYGSFAKNGLRIKRIDDGAKKTNYKFIPFDVVALYCIMPFVCIFSALIILSPLFVILNVFGVLEYGGGSFDPDAEYAFRR